MEVAAFGLGLLGLWVLATAFTLAAHAAHDESIAHVELIALGGFFTGVFGAMLIVPALALQVRRLHDLNLSGWWLLLALLPYLGQAALLVALCLPGTRGDNRFGADPRQQMFMLPRAG